ncbi:MAG: hypothetical protein IT429_11405 [Gemmataceae bacterium]|nr:hypothetical protein [Gemmataceae bacterium]
MTGTRRAASLCGLAVLLLGGLGAAGEPARRGAVKSSLQPGEMIPSAFHPLNVTGEHAGKEHCLVCENGLNPVVMVFARNVSEPLARLLVRLDTTADRHRKQSLGTFVVFLGKAEELQPRLEKLAREKKLRHVVLSIDGSDGPEGYNVARAADVTVVLYTEHRVRANHAFRKGELTDRDIDGIVADLPKILPGK